MWYMVIMNVAIILMVTSRMHNALLGERVDKAVLFTQASPKLHYVVLN